MRRLLRHRSAAALPAAAVAIVLGIAAGGGNAAAEPDDRWSTSYSAAQYLDRQEFLDGRYDGVGLRLTLDDDRLVVGEVVAGTSAARAGVRAGEQVVSVDSRAVGADDLDEVVQTLRSATAPVDAVVAGVTGERRITLEAASTRGEVVHVARTSDGDRVLRIDAVVRGAAEQVEQALAGPAADIDTGVASGIVLDLRGNGGGLVTEAVKIAGVFLDGGHGVSYDRADGSRRSVAVPERTQVNQLPLVVLVDDGTASAAEIVAGILQDRGRAIVVGQRTFGKGTVQEPMVQADGTVVERTVGHYALPSGRLLDGVGLDPDVVVRDVELNSAAYAAATLVLDGLAPRTQREY
jgi:carboxyl-terminal processing protease